MYYPRSYLEFFLLFHKQKKYLVFRREAASHDIPLVFWFEQTSTAQRRELEWVMDRVVSAEGIFVGHFVPEGYEEVHSLSEEAIKLLTSEPSLDD